MKKGGLVGFGYWGRILLKNPKANQPLCVFVCL